MGLIKSFGCAIAGLLTMLRTERNAKIHAVAVIVVVSAGLHFGVSKTDWLWLIVAMMAVVSAEAFNTALEALCDHVSPERSEAIKVTKDVAAGAVLVCSVGALVIGLLVFWPYINEVAAT